MNIISDWLEKHGDPKITEQVRKEAELLNKQQEMDTSKHTVTIPISDYEELVHRSHTLSMYDTVLDKIEETIRDKLIDRDTKYARIQTIMNNWCLEHDLEEDQY